MASGSPSDADQLETLLSSADCAEELVVSDLGLVNLRPHRAEHDQYGVSARSVEPATPGVLQHRLVAGLTDVNAERDVTGSPLIPSPGCPQPFGITGQGAHRDPVSGSHRTETGLDNNRA